MNFYDKYLRGVDAGKMWPAVAIPTIAAYNGFLAAGVKQLVAVALSALIFLSSLITFLIVPKTPEQLATEPRVLAETAKAVIAPVLGDAQGQLEDVVSDVAETVRETTDPVKQMADKLERAAAVLRGDL